ncbi:NACHT, LRR and PYD domains-containing protein 1b allele 3-like [Seriola dumerili]|uniref:NACHT, LRR and PYD domains-containing protein 1b allele 3-like n=1 Tax=Seriola dumerili TaxID=41447 RepID=UPI000BBEB050|nr:NACHT, LRR and PYD domains-containing protein 1b allele 3-like [Seriola dumerili]XP_022625234.1 NACHT, LRR and PYD domains-containing protein 1b allele 3-like [Seriola dumerili]
MASTVKHERTGRGSSCFSRAARSIRDALSRICRVNSAQPDPDPDLDYTDRYPFSAFINDARTEQHCLNPERLSRPIARSFIYYSPYYCGKPVQETGRGSFYDTDGSLSFFGIDAHEMDSLDSWPHGGSVYETSKFLSQESFLRPESHGYCKNEVMSYSPCPQSSLVVSPDVTVHTEGQDAFQSFTLQPENTSDSEALVETEASVAAVNYSVTNTLPTCSQLHISSSDPGLSGRDSGRLPRSVSVPSLSQIISAENRKFRRAQSSPDVTSQTSYEEFTPDITEEENDESYSFQCSRPGLYQCRVTGLLFHMEGEGDVVYRIVPWDRRQLAQYHKKPAGPLFDIRCVQQSVCRLHLPHCEISSTGGCHFLSVAHVKEESMELITPHEITETHVIINITGFSGFGNVKDEDSPPVPVRALVLLFYRPSPDPDVESVINVLLLPKNVSVLKVQRTRKKLVGDERYIEKTPQCKLQPDQVYTLSTCPEDDSLRVEPTESEFDCNDYDNFFPSFQVYLKKMMKTIQLFLKESKSSHSVWAREVCLSLTTGKSSHGSSQTLLDIRSSLIHAISEPVLQSLLDKLLEIQVITDPEWESVDEMQNKRDKVRFVIDTVRKKGEAASSEMIEFLCEADPFLCEHLGLL